MESDDPRHEPVLLDEVVGLVPNDARLVVDGTLGLGGHARAILDARPDARLIGFDRDGEALARARARLASFGDRFEGRHGDFRQGLGALPDAAACFILLDLGVSSYQLDAAERGFSFRFDAPLDMRMDRSRGETAAEILATRREAELERILREYGEEPAAARIARDIAESRRRTPLRTTLEFAALVRRRARGKTGLDAATRSFQALRIATNRELESLDASIELAVTRLRPRGRLAVISFHSLEDRAAKLALRSAVRSGVARFVIEKPLRPSDVEAGRNPRARSARLRAVERRDPPTGGRV